MPEARIWFGSLYVAGARSLPILRLVIGRRVQSRLVRQTRSALTNTKPRRTQRPGGEYVRMPALLAHSMFEVSLRTKLSVSVLAQRKIESARPRKHGLFLLAEEKTRLYGRTLAKL